MHSRVNANVRPRCEAAPATARPRATSHRLIRPPRIESPATRIAACAYAVVLLLAIAGALGAVAL